MYLLTIYMSPLEKHLFRSLPISWLRKYVGGGINPRNLGLTYIVLYIGEGNGTPLQYSCLENPMDGGAW